MPVGPWEPPSGRGYLKKSYSLDLDSEMLMKKQPGSKTDP